VKLRNECTLSFKSQNITKTERPKPRFGVPETSRAAAQRAPNEDREAHSPIPSPQRGEGWPKAGVRCPPATPPPLQHNPPCVPSPLVGERGARRRLAAERRAG
jgi:hypothetical protein